MSIRLLHAANFIYRIENRSLKACCIQNRISLVPAAIPMGPIERMVRQAKEVVEARFWCSVRSLEFMGMVALDENETKLTKLDFAL